ncbi:hypothetical protein AB0L88_23575 [Saccharopolyspora shandongensis]|uniref:hypothetical protein n=1 Tax=Saccharopolyspora shandongensis TaxID=418495 RepID=UPI0034185B33
MTVSNFRFCMARNGVEELTAEQVECLIGLAGNARDQFLIALLGRAGIRIGEALGLRREDMHLLADSQALGCAIKGPHIHVRRRRDNANGALVKARRWGNEARSSSVTGIDRRPPARSKCWNSCRWSRSTPFTTSGPTTSDLAQPDDLSSRRVVSSTSIVLGTTRPNQIGEHPRRGM